MRETGQSWLSLLKKKGEQRGGLEKGSRGVYANADVRADRGWREWKEQVQNAEN